MTKLNEIYKCAVCGNVVEVLQEADGQLVCCGQPMNKLVANTADAAEEKHVPVIEVNGNKVTVKIGDVPHPMEESHYINLIEVLSGGKVIASYQPSPGEEPKTEFVLDDTEGISARALCNLHGLWASK